MKRFDVALIGLGVMGQSLARNLASRKLNVLVYNRHSDKAKDFIDKYGNEYLDYRNNLMMLTEELESPRKIILMVPAGKPVDEMIAELMPFISNGDIIIDAGNSFYSDTIRRKEALQKKDIHYVGMGVSGGEEGALRGPSIMVGSEDEVWKELSPILKKIAAKDFSDKPCVAHISTDGAGHFVKMVHNGIEYAVMQLMAEAYEMLKEIYHLDARAISKIFDKFNKGKLKSYLFEISAEVLAKKDEFKKGYLVDFILDKAGQKGTGRWTVIDAFLRGASTPTIGEAVFSRSISAQKDERVALGKIYKFKKSRPKIPLAKFVKLLEGALYAGMISCYAQGFELIRIAEEEQKWKINFAEVARIWEGGCIIRAELLNFLHKSFMKNKGKAENLFAMAEIKKAMTANIPSLTEIVSAGVLSGTAIPALSASLNFFRSMTSPVLPANFIQGLRDYFGAHTYERTDKDGVFHTQWSDLTI